MNHKQANNEISINTPRTVYPYWTSRKQRAVSKILVKQRWTAELLLVSLPKNISPSMHCMVKYSALGPHGPS